jgi:uncharacterized membrane protein YqjE
MPATPTGLFDSLRGLFATALELAQVRLELLISDLELEKQRLASVALLGLFGMLLIGTGLLLFIGLLLLLFWELHRLPALIVLMLLCLGAGAWLMVAARRRLTGGVLETSRNELERDRGAVRRGEIDEHAQL